VRRVRIPALVCVGLCIVAGDASPLEGSGRLRFLVMTRTRLPGEGSELITGLSDPSVEKIELYNVDRATGTLDPRNGVFADVVTDVVTTKAVVRFNDGRSRLCNFGSPAAFQEPAC
jgi:hypothetical protein